MIDYHLHGNFCGHGTGELESYVLVAVQKGFKEIGFSAHLPKVKNPDPYHAMLEDKLPVYVKLVHELQDIYAGKIKIKLGIEADFFEGYQRETARLLRLYPFDYVIGAVHFLGDWHFTSREGIKHYRKEDPERAFPLYFDQLFKMIETGLFDIVAHPDAIRREDFRPDGSLRAEYVRIADVLKARGMALEVNSGGIRRGAGSPYPEREMLEICVERGVPVTLGSDAHCPDDVGRDFNEVFRLLALAGARNIAIFNSRKITEIPISNFYPLDKQL
jgi:histidinol-phosphatase (PHP family)